MKRRKNMPGRNMLLPAIMTACILTLGAGSCAAEEAGNGHAPDWAKNAVLYEVNIRQYTPEGTFAAFSEHLEELKDMGIDTLWFMPIHPISETNRAGTLGSYYSVSDYRDVNPEFGTLEDFGALVGQAHEMGFHIILDWVANHTGWDNAWINEHPDWYTQQDGKIISPQGMGWNDVADLNYDNSDMRQEMIDCMKFWVTEYDIDGFRCDYAAGVPSDFWAEARSQLEEVKPLFFLEEDLAGQNGKLLEEAFDCNYSAKFLETLIHIAHNNKKADKLRLYRLSMPEGDFPMYYLDNHDVNSYDRTLAEGFPEETLPSMWSLIFTQAGIPMMYSGDEITYDHRIEFMEKDPIDWSAVTWDASPLIKELAGLKKDNPALDADSSFEDIKLEEKNVAAYRRTSGDNSVVCLFNLSRNELADIDLSGAAIEGGTVLLSGSEGSWSTEGELPGAAHTFAPWEFMIILEDKP